jgi:hypothetical protein
MSARYDWVRLTDRLTKNARIGTPRLSRCVTVSSCLAVLALRLSREMRVVQGALAHGKLLPEDSSDMTVARCVALCPTSTLLVSSHHASQASVQHLPRATLASIPWLRLVEAKPC